MCTVQAAVCPAGCSRRWRGMCRIIRYFQNFRYIYQFLFSQCKRYIKFCLLIVFLRWLFLQPPIHQLQAAGAFSGFSSSLMNIWVSFSMLLHYYLSPNFKLLNGHWTSGSQFLCSCTYDHNEPQFLYLYMNMTDELREDSSGLKLKQDHEATITTSLHEVSALRSRH